MQRGTNNPEISLLFLLFIHHLQLVARDDQLRLPLLVSVNRSSSVKSLEQLPTELSFEKFFFFFNDFIFFFLAIFFALRDRRDLTSMPEIWHRRLLKSPFTEAYDKSLTGGVPPPADTCLTSRVRTLTRSAVERWPSSRAHLTLKNPTPTLWK